jgi:hypothetical protein
VGNNYESDREYCGYKPSSITSPLYLCAPTSGAPNFGAPEFNWAMKNTVPALIGYQITELETELAESR